MTEALPKNRSLAVDDCKLQIQGFDCFKNNNKSQYHSGVLIYTKKRLKAVAIKFTEPDYREYVYCKLSFKKNGLLHILCIYRSPNSTIENNKNLNGLIWEFSESDSHLLILGDFIYAYHKLSHVGYIPQQRKLCYKISDNYTKLLFLSACK